MVECYTFNYIGKFYYQIKNMPILHILKDYQSKYFLTFTVIEWIDIFTCEDYFILLSDCINFCINNKGLIINGYVFMTNHIHLLADTKSNYNLIDIVRDFKRHSTREVVKLIISDNRSYIRRLLYKSYKKRGENKLQIWKSNNWPEVVDNSYVYNLKLNYIHENPVIKGYVDDPSKWKYSSAKEYYTSNSGPIRVTVE
jgi:putative transposase